MIQKIASLYLYLFAIKPSNHFAFASILTFIVIAIWVFAIFLKFQLKRNKHDKAFKRSFRNYPWRLFNLGLLIGLYTYCRTQFIPYLSARFILLLILCWGAWIAYSLVNTYLNKYPHSKKLLDEQEKLSRFLPKKK